MEREKKSKNKPLLLVFAGPNGSGKSTITEYFETKNYTNAVQNPRGLGATLFNHTQISPVSYPIHS